MTSVALKRHLPLKENDNEINICGYIEFTFDCLQRRFVYQQVPVSFMSSSPPCVELLLLLVLQRLLLLLLRHLLRALEPPRMTDASSAGTTELGCGWEVRERCRSWVEHRDVDDDSGGTVRTNAHARNGATNHKNNNSSPFWHVPGRQYLCWYLK